MKWKLTAFRESFQAHRVGDDEAGLRPDMGPQRHGVGAKTGRSTGTFDGKKHGRSGESAGDSAGASAPRSPSPGGGIYGLGRGRRVVVKARYRKHQAVRRGGRQRVLAAHVRYLARPNATGLERGDAFFDARGEAFGAADVPRAWAQDRHHWRIILSPEDGDQLDLRRFVRDYARRLERELDTPLDWVAVTHHNTDQPHAHLLIRGRRGDGRDLTIPRATARDGLPAWAEELATRALGERSDADADAYLNRLAAARRMTPLDALLARLARSGAGAAEGWEVRVPRDFPPELAGRHHLERRLEALADMGLAERVTPRFRRAKWRVRDDFTERLRAGKHAVAAVERNVAQGPRETGQDAPARSAYAGGATRNVGVGAGISPEQVAVNEPAEVGLE